MNIIGITQDGVEHKIVNGKLEPPIVVPAHIHERALRKINETRRIKFEAENEGNKG